MLCPDCKHNTFEPLYMESINPYIDDSPHALHHQAHRDVLMFRCSDCLAVYYAFGRESAAEAYWRIIRDYAKD